MSRELVRYSMRCHTIEMEEAAHSPSHPEPDLVHAKLLEVLDLTPKGVNSLGMDTFSGECLPQPNGRVFGGQVLAQSMIAAGRTVASERPIHSLHAYFLRQGNLDLPILFAVERLRDGGSFSARRIHALQAGEPILTMMCSFQEPSEGLEHFDPMPDAPDPESLPSTYQLMREIPGAEQWAIDRPIDIRHIESPLYFGPGNDQTDHQMVWMKALTPMDDDPLLHSAVLAFASDYTLLEPILRRQGLSWSVPNMRMASLDHSMWFHCPVRVDEWVLCDQSSPAAAGARGLSGGKFYNSAGRQVATVAQEMLIRVPQE